MDMRLQPTYELEDLLYHEGLPGHHMQIATILMDRGIPKLRKVNQWWQDTAFVEGWGLYAEQLGKDMGSTGSLLGPRPADGPSCGGRAGWWWTAPALQTLVP